MKLIIDIDSLIENSSCLEDTIVLTNNTSLFGNNIYHFNVSYLDEYEYTAQSINSFFEKLPDEFSPLRNVVYMRVFRPVFALIRQTEDLILEYNIDQIILNGGGNFPFITLYGGEGEGDYKFYKPSSLHNYFVYLYFKDSVNVAWINKQNSFYVNIKHRLRENILSLKFIKRATIYTIKGNKNNTENKEIRSYENLTFVFGRVSYNNFIGLLDSSLLEKTLFIKPITLKLVPNLNSISYKVSFLDYVKAYIKYLRLKQMTSCKNIALNLFGKTVEFKSNILLKALRYSYVEYYANYISLNRKLDKTKFSNQAKFISNITFGEELTLINSISKNHKLPHYNFQSVAMSKMWYPQVDLADKYFMYTKESYEFYNKLDSSYRFYLPVKNSKNRYIDFNKKNNLIVTLFTQPDRYADYYLDFIQEFKSSLNKINLKIDLIIKPHYRQNKMSEFIKLVGEKKNISLEETSSKPIDFINKSDFIISMTSSVIFEAFQHNCPAIVLDISGNDSKFIQLNCMPDVNYVVKSIEEVIDILNNPIKYTKKYIDRRDEYIASNKAADYKKYL